MDPFSIIEEAPEQRLHDKYEQLTSANTADHDVQYAAALRARFPELSLTTIPAGSCNLLRFAAAGHAIAELDESTDPIFRWRGWVPSYGRNTTAGIGQSVFFAKFHYKWNNQDFVLYTIGNLQYVLKEPERSVSPATPSIHTDALIAACGTWQVSDKDVIYVYDGYWRADSDLFQEVAKASWDKVILDENMKKDLTGVTTKFFDNEDVYKDLGVPWKRGLIFYGPAGNGKTISIKALMKTLRDRSPSVPSLYVKQAPYPFNIGQIFQFARLSAPCMLVFEDIETIITPNSRSYFLNEVDGLATNDGILMVASTNFLERLDPGLTKRPSRFDRKYLFPLPNEHERTLYAEYWRGRIQKNESKRLHVDFPQRLCPAMAKITEEFSFAYMQEAFVASLLAIVRDIDDPEETARPAAQRSAASQALYDTLRPRTQKDKFADLDEYKLWRVFREQVHTLRQDMDHSTLNELQQTWRAPSVPAASPPPLPERPAMAEKQSFFVQSTPGPAFTPLRDLLNRPLYPGTGIHADPHALSWFGADMSRLSLSGGIGQGRQQPQPYSRPTVAPPSIGLSGGMANATQDLGFAGSKYQVVNSACMQNVAPGAPQGLASRELGSDEIAQYGVDAAQPRGPS